MNIASVTRFACVAKIDQNAWDAVEFGSVTDQLVLFQKCRVPPVVRNKPGETQAEFGVLKARVWHMAKRERDMQRSVSSHVIIIGGEFHQNSPQMLLVEHGQPPHQSGVNKKFSKLLGAARPTTKAPPQNMRALHHQRILRAERHWLGDQHNRPAAGNRANEVSNFAQTPLRKVG
jgi:hypothetical protein